MAVVMFRSRLCTEVNCRDSPGGQVIHLYLLWEVLGWEDTSRTEPFSLDVLGKVCTGDDILCQVVECPETSARH